MSSIDSLRRQAADLGLVLITREQGEKVAGHVRETYNRVMGEHAAEFRVLAEQLRAGATMPLWAEGEQGAIAAERMAETFESYPREMNEIAQACEYIVQQDESGNVVLSYNEEGYRVDDYEHNEFRDFATEAAAQPYYAERVAAVKAMVQS